MIGILSNIDIELEVKPKMELVSSYLIDVNYEEVKHNSAQIQFENMVTGIYSNNDIQYSDNSELYSLSKLSNDQSYFLKLAFEKMDKTISLEHDYLILENVELPNEYSKEYSKKVLYQLALRSIFPGKISASIEEGICFKFKNKNFIFYLEVYNDESVSYIIEDTFIKSIVEFNELTSLEIITDKVMAFYNS
ncbi:MAG: hypothetical protein V9E90_02280 [Saprospiraceae bacterium]